MIKGESVRTWDARAAGLLSPESRCFQKNGTICGNKSTKCAEKSGVSGRCSTRISVVIGFGEYQLGSDSSEKLRMVTLSSFEKLLVDRIRNSEEFQTYQESFRGVTGLPLRLVAADEPWCLVPGAENQSPFCRLLNETHSGHISCRDVNQRIVQIAGIQGATTQTCFAGLATTSVPVHFEGKIIAFLKTGQVFREPPTDLDFDRLRKQFLKWGISEDQMKRLRESYLETRTVLPRRYGHMVVLLDIFAGQISAQASSLAMMIEGSIPEPVEKALHHVRKHLDQHLALEETAHLVGLSRAHFSRLFTSAVGCPFTEYVARSRVTRARELLQRPAMRVSEIAQACGFQSLSQFNRVFQKYTGQTPTAFRKECVD